MFDNWTHDMFFRAVDWEGSLDEVAANYGRLAIVDDENLEKVWDRYVQARAELEQLYTDWILNQPELDDNDD